IGRGCGERPDDRHVVDAGRRGVSQAAQGDQRRWWSSPSSQTKGSDEGFLLIFTTQARMMSAADRDQRLIMNDAHIQAKAIIAAALIQSRGVDPEGLASPNKDISNKKLTHLRDLTERIYAALAASGPEPGAAR